MYYIYCNHQELDIDIVYRTDSDFTSFIHLCVCVSRCVALCSFITYVDSCKHLIIQTQSGVITTGVPSDISV